MRPGLVLAFVLYFPLASLAQSPVRLPQLQAAAEIVRDRSGIAHLRALNEHDLFLLQGWVHAEDRLFQMDVSRRRASGTLAELLGRAALPGDVQLRTFGLRRAAERSLPLISARARSAMEAYAEGVNAFVTSHPLPPEYAALRLTRFEPWRVLDTLAVGKLIAFGLSFDLDDIDRTVALLSYREAGRALRFDGTKLFFQDLFRSAPFDPASTIPDALGPPPGAAEGQPDREANEYEVDPRAVEMGKEFLERVRAEPFLRQILNHDDRAGSNQWAIAGRFTETGFPMLASDPHLGLGAPSTFYPVHLRAGGFEAIGNSFPGSPAVIVGHNRNVAWGATVNPLDVTDVFQEHVVSDPSSPSGLSTVFRGHNEPIIPIPESYRANEISDGLFDHIVLVPPNPPAIPPATLIVPRRNQGPLVQLDLAHQMGLSVQFTGFSGTREVETFLAFDTARNVNEFRNGLRFFDFGSQNFVYADTARNIAYFTASAVPIREDLQQGFVLGLPPYFIRNGTGGNEWLPVQHPQPGQVVPFEVLPLEEMPHIANPPAGFLINANNDPIGITLGNDPLSRTRPGGGIYYLSPGYDLGTRAGRITRRVRDQLTNGQMSFEAMQSIQADAKLLDAEVFVPLITAALTHAQRDGAPPPLAALAASPGLAEAVGRLAGWDTSTPTGIPQGYDPAGDDSDESQRGSNSIAATLYSVWRGQFIRGVIDAHLGSLPKPPGQQAMTAVRNLIDRFADRHGVGESGVDFFAIPGVALPAEDRRDILVLQSLRGALDRLSGAPFAAAFNNSTDQNDYRWGKLHRIVFAHPMDGPFSVPPAFGLFPHPIAPLLGIPKQGGFGVVDASAHDPRADSVNSFMFGSGPSNRLVVSLDAEELRAESVWPGGVSALPSSPFYLNLLPLWLRNQTVPLLTSFSDLEDDAASVTRFVP